MMRAQEAMDRNEAWDYNAEIKTILSKLGINDTNKYVRESFQVVNKNVLF